MLEGRRSRVGTSGCVESDTTLSSSSRLWEDGPGSNQTREENPVRSIIAVLALMCVAVLPCTALGDPLATASKGQGSAAHAAAVFTNLSLPTITGTAVEGQTLNEVHANWSSPPAGYAYQWQRCNSSGKDCSAISGAKTRSYRLAAADVGSTIRVGESASDAEGAVTPSVSEPTAVVRAQTESEHNGGSGTDGNVPPSGCCETSTHPDPAEIKALITRQLAPSGRAASISALLAHGGLRMSFAFPEAGTFTVQWYFVPSGAKLARRKKLKPTLLASGQARFTAAGTVGVGIRLTAQGRGLLRHARKIDLEAKGAFAPSGQAAVSAVKKFALRR